MRRLLAYALLLSAAGCNGKPTTLLESDVSVPPGFEVRFSQGIEREGGTLAGGDFLLWGNVKDMRKTADETALRYSDHGWREGERTLLANLAIFQFSKDDRTCRVEIDRRRVAPDMSSAVIRVGKIGDPAPERQAAPPEAPVDPAPAPSASGG